MDSNNIKEENSRSLASDGIVNQKISNPIEKPKIMPLNTRTSANRLFSGYTNSYYKTNDINYTDLINAINVSFSNQTDIVHLFYSIYNNICSRLNLNFSALGIFNQNSNYINVKLIDKTGASYNSKIMLSDDENIIVKSFKNKQIILTTDSEYLKLSYLNNVATHVIPLIAFGECVGVIIFADNNANQYFELYKLIANYIAIFYKNRMLSDLVDRNTDTDSLTGLSNHKKLQEDLALEITQCGNYDKKLAFCIFDIANISEINNELGHAKGDEVIKEVAKKIKKNVRNTDVLGRYGGDKIAIIMPDTTDEEAKYVCEYLLYN